MLWQIGSVFFKWALVLPKTQSFDPIVSIFHPDFSNPISLFSGFPLFLSGTRVCVSESQCAVTAIDNDGPDSPAGQITYSIVSTNNKFVIDKDTGVLSTNAVSQRCIHHSEGRDLLTISMVSHKCNHDSM